jgi:hypothetical protein
VSEDNPIVEGREEMFISSKHITGQVEGHRIFKRLCGEVPKSLGSVKKFLLARFLMVVIPKPSTKS